MPDSIDCMMNIITGARKLRSYYKEELIDINQNDKLTIGMYFREIERYTICINETIIKLLVEVLDESKEFGQVKIRQEMAKYQRTCIPDKG